ncbi:MAG: beta-ketoacyl-ACP synthase II [Tissierellia bacterium]|nr:beta-ketoacyl-ACP synthase II [Tissierellia bacterium]
MRRVVVTGLGFVTPLGNDVDTLVKHLKDGYCAVDFIKGYDVEKLKVKIACEAKDFDPLDYFTKKEIRRMDRVNMFGIVASRFAQEDSGLDFSQYPPTRIAIMMASGIGGIDTIEKESFKAFEKGFSKISPFFTPTVITNMTAAQVAIDLGIHGYVGCPVTACAASANAILDGYRSIKDGYHDVVLAGGSEASINGLGIGGFTSMRALNEENNPNRASIPFDKERSGFVMGEGSVVLVLEELEKAKARGAKIYGEILGGAMTCDANHITAPDESGKWVRLAMTEAMRIGHISLEDVDYINTHGTSTPLNDKIETKAIKDTFGELANQLYVSSTKSMTGHLLGASGSLEAMISLLAIQNNFIPPTVNYKVPDPECDLNITPNTSIEKDINIALSNSLGFGGHNVCLALKGYEI